MKLMKIMFAAALALSFSSAYAFHDGGVAYCEGCHTMHNSRNGASMSAGGTQFVGKTYLLQGTDQSSTCLICHAKGNTLSGYHVMTHDASATLVPAQRTPGGDFGWLKLGDRTGGRSVNLATARGHNIIAADNGLVVDSRLVTGPGGNYPAASLHCSSCHDPHGKFRLTSAGTFDANPGFTKGAPSLNPPAVKSVPIIGSGSTASALPPAGEAVGSYRILAGVGYRPASVSATNVDFTADPPVAVSPGTYNRSEAVSDTRVAYGKGMSEWCGNCHGQIHNDSYPSALIHPAGDDAKMTTETVGNYNAYVNTGDMTGVVATAFSSLTPFESGTVDLAALSAKLGTTTGPSATDNVMCLSCHRAHASAFESMTRWNVRYTFITEDGVYGGAAGPDDLGAGYTPTEYQAAMYDRAPSKFSTFQRSLCNKCHAKD